MITRPGNKGFTLIEMLVAITVLVILLGILFAITNTVAKTVVNTSAKLDTFAAARAGFDLMSQKLSQATLNTYWDYDNPVTPTVYRRMSDLQFLVMQNTQAPGYGQEVYFTTPATYSADSTLRSTDGLLSACGYYISYGPDDSFRPSTITTAASRYRYRLMQGIEPTENLSIYANQTAAVASMSGTSAFTNANMATASFWSGSYWPTITTVWSSHSWINNINNLGSNAPNRFTTPVANNIIAMIVWPRLSPIDDSTGSKLTSIIGAYNYDSQYNATATTQPITAEQLPPTVQITMIAISEASAARLSLNLGSAKPTVIENALSGKFVQSNYAQYEADLTSVTGTLAANHIAYEVLNTSVTMKESKWSDTSQ